MRVTVGLNEYVLLLSSPSTLTLTVYTRALAVSAMAVLAFGISAGFETVRDAVTIRIESAPGALRAAKALEDHTYSNVGNRCFDCRLPREATRQQWDTRWLTNRINEYKLNESKLN